MPWQKIITSSLAIILLIYSLYKAYSIRFLSISTYGYLIHEYDPWFNYRSAVYLYEHGWKAFFNWFDTKSWYPIGRHIGKTSFPGMQIISVYSYIFLRYISNHFSMSFNDFCCLIPCFGGVVSTFFCGLIAYEITGSLMTCSISAFFMAIAPTHLSRSMGGSFDNECVAFPLMVMIFYFWLLSLRTRDLNTTNGKLGLVITSLATALTYGAMASAWGGHIFPLNVIAVHVFCISCWDWILNRYNASVLYAYSIFYIGGTFLTLFVPVIGWSAFFALERLAGLFSLFGLVLLHYSEKKRKINEWSIRSFSCLRHRLFYMGILACIITLWIFALKTTGIFVNLHPRLQILFFDHVESNNPLVESIAEHQSTVIEFIRFKAGITIYSFVVGGFLLFLWPAVISKPYFFSFIILLALLNSFFMTRMTRLLFLFCLPLSILTGIALGCLFEVNVRIFNNQPPIHNKFVSEKKAHSAKMTKKNLNAGSGHSIVSHKFSFWEEKVNFYLFRLWKLLHLQKKLIRFILITMITLASLLFITIFYQYAEELVKSMSYPIHVFSSRIGGESVLITDYVDTYDWISENTPQDARIMSWWDYGYPITGFTNRTTLADGNTWLDEHIALIGKLMIGRPGESHPVIRHLADYVLVQCLRDSDINKAFVMARIANSVFPNICASSSITCREYANFGDSFVSRALQNTLVYRLSTYGDSPKIHLPTNMFRLVYQSAHGLMRVYQVLNVDQDSKEWVENNSKYICKSRTQWQCRREYPPAPELQNLLNTRQFTSKHGI